MNLAYIIYGTGAVGVLIDLLALVLIVVIFVWLIRFFMGRL